MLQRIQTFLNQPYPDRDDLPSLVKGSIFTGILVFLILFVLKPFGLHQLGSGLLPYALVFGAITTLVTLSFDLTIRYVFGIRRDTGAWTLWKWALSVTVLILIISLANYFFIGLAFGMEYSWDSLWSAVYNTFAVGVFPVVFFGGWNMIRHLKENQKVAADIHPHQASGPERFPVELVSLNNTASFAIDAADILYVEAMQNYVNVVFTTAAGSGNHMLRNTIASMEELLQHTPVKRCHRSFLVNTDRIASVAGNAQGLKLTLTAETAPEIPVSRKYIPVFKD